MIFLAHLPAFIDLFSEDLFSEESSGIPQTFKLPFHLPVSASANIATASQLFKKTYLAQPRFTVYSLYCKLLLSSKEIAMANTATHVSVSNLVSLPAYMAVREAKRAQVTLKKTVSWLQPRFVSSAVSRAQVSKQAITRSLCDAFGGSRCSTSTKNFVGRNIRVSKYVLSGRCP